MHGDVPDCNPGRQTPKGWLRDAGVGTTWKREPVLLPARRQHHFP